MILVKLVSNMIWLMVNIKIWLKEQNETKCQETELLTLLGIQTMIEIKED